MFTKFDKNIIIMLLSKDDIDSDDMYVIYDLYKKYINSNAIKFLIDCDCKLSIYNMKKELVELFISN